MKNRISGIKTFFKKYKLEVFLILGLIVTFCTIFLYQNYRILKQTATDREYINIPLSDLEYTCFKLDGDKLLSTCSNKSITINKNIYVDKLDIIYDTSTNYSWKIEEESANYYGIYENLEFTGLGSNKINIFTEKIKRTVNKTKISITTDDKFTISSVAYDNRIKFYKKFYIVAFILIVSIYLLTKFNNKILKKPEYGFLIIAITFGSIFLTLVPNLTISSWDDEVHFATAYEAFSGKEYGITESALAEIQHTLNGTWRFNTLEEYNAFYKWLDSNNTIIVVKGTQDPTIIFKEIAYWPSSLVIHIVKRLNCPFHIMYWLGRLANLITYIIVIFFAIRKTPKFKKMFTIIGLLPTTLFLSTQYHYDPYVSGFILLALAHLFNILYNDDNKNILKDIGLFMLFIVIGCNAKMLYIPLILLIFLIPSSKFKDKKHSILIKLICVAITIGIVSIFLNPTSLSGNTDYRSGATSSAMDQVNFVTSQPISFLKVFYNSAIVEFATSFLGQDPLIKLGYYTTVNSTNAYYLFLILIITTFILEDYVKLRKRDIVLLAIINLSLWAAVFGALYVSFTQAGSTTILGYQFRYFIPLFGTMFLMLMPFKKNIKIKCDNTYFYKIYIVLYIVYTITIVENLFPLL